MTPVEEHLAEAERQARFAEQRIDDDVLQASSHCSAAWAALAAAEQLGADPHRLVELRLSLHRWGSEVGIPRVQAYAATIRDDAFRAWLYRALAIVTRTERDWILREVERGAITGLALDELIALWAGWPETLEMMAKAPLA